MLVLTLRHRGPAVREGVAARPTSPRASRRRSADAPSPRQTRRVAPASAALAGGAPAPASAPPRRARAADAVALDRRDRAIERGSTVDRPAAAAGRRSLAPARARRPGRRPRRHRRRQLAGAPPGDGRAPPAAGPARAAGAAVRPGRRTQAFDSYARYWVESFRLPGTDAPRCSTPASASTATSTSTPAWPQGNGVILALPHLGGWEWAGFWMAEVQSTSGHRRGRAARAARAVRVVRRRSAGRSA